MNVTCSLLAQLQVENQVLLGGVNPVPLVRVAHLVVAGDDAVEDVLQGLGAAWPCNPLLQVHRFLHCSKVVQRAWGLLLSCDVAHA